MNFAILANVIKFLSKISENLFWSVGSLFWSKLDRFSKFKKLNSLELNLKANGRVIFYIALVYIGTNLIRNFYHEILHVKMYLRVLRKFPGASKGSGM